MFLGSFANRWNYNWETMATHEQSLFQIHEWPFIAQYAGSVRLMLWPTAAMCDAGDLYFQKLPYGGQLDPNKSTYQPG